MENKEIIVLVEDHQAIREVVKAYLEYCGYEVQTAHSLVSAQVIFHRLIDENKRPKAIITDMQYESNGAGLGGVALANWIRTFPAFKEVPIILITAMAPYLHAQYKELFVRSYQKPFDTAEIAEFLKTL
jgi:CheY-like chemotaxis protein